MPDTDTEIVPQRPWYNEAEFAEFADYEFHLAIHRDGRLALCTANHDYRDAITGWTYRFAPPSQQYGHRLRAWLYQQRPLAESVLDPEWPDGIEPF